MKDLKVPIIIFVCTATLMVFAIKIDSDRLKIIRNQAKIVSSISYQEEMICYLSERIDLQLEINRLKFVGLYKEVDEIKPVKKWWKAW